MWDRSHHNRMRTLEEKLSSLLKTAEFEPICVRTLFTILSGKGYPLLLILLSLPFCQPIQIPGFSVPFGIAIAFIGLRMAFGKKLWLPKKLLDKEIPRNALCTIVQRCLLFIRKTKWWMHPRWVWFARHPWFRVCNNFLVVLLGILLALPLPIPLSNLVAAWSLLCISMGIAQDDGVVICIGYLLTIVCLFFFFATFKVLEKFVQIVLNVYNDT